MCRPILHVSEPLYVSCPASHVSLSRRWALPDYVSVSLLKRGQKLMNTLSRTTHAGSQSRNGVLHKFVWLKTQAKPTRTQLMIRTSSRDVASPFYLMRVAS